MMTYLQAALSETLRLCPAVPSDVKYAIADDTFPSGATLKAGWRVAYHPFAQGHDPKVWGSDALDFKPERWIDDAGHFIQHSPYKFPSFQVGGLPPLSLPS
jgi:cytochrome P450